MRLLDTASIPNCFQEDSGGFGGPKKAVLDSMVT